MRAYGDIPADHLNLIEELQNLEYWFNIHGDEISQLSSAKGFVSMAHDWYMMEIEEEGERLLKRAEKECPGYFKGPIFVHIAKDEDFAMLVAGLAHTMALGYMVALGFEL